jgi:hypothetical protein
VSKPGGLLLDGFAGLFPGFDAAFEVHDFGEVERIHFAAGFGAATAYGAMDQISFALVELFDFLVKIFGVEIDQD